MSFEELAFIYEKIVESGQEKILGSVGKKLGGYIKVVSEQETEIDSEPAMQITCLICRSHRRSPDKILRKEVDTIAIKNNTLWVIGYMARPDHYDQVNKAYFEPMIQSFKFEASRKAPFGTTKELS